MLVPGVYNYTFQCNLPIGLPTSVEGIHGHIRYSATVTLIRPMWTDQEFEEGFTVIKPVDLNDQPQLFVRIDTKQKIRQIPKLPPPSHRYLYKWKKRKHFRRVACCAVFNRNRSQYGERCLTVATFRAPPFP